MDITTLRVAATVVSFLAFLGVLGWAFAPRNARRFDDDARLPFEDADPADRGSRS